MPAMPRKKQMTCPYCSYKWVSRTYNPKKCPMCQKWLPKWADAQMVK